MSVTPACHVRGIFLSILPGQLPHQSTPQPSACDVLAWPRWRWVCRWRRGWCVCGRPPCSAPVTCRQRRCADCRWRHAGRWGDMPSAAGTRKSTAPGSPAHHKVFFQTDISCTPQGIFPNWQWTGVTDVFFQTVSDTEEREVCQSVPGTFGRDTLCQSVSGNWGRDTLC